MNLSTFQQSRPYTLGVELELQILDAETLNLTQAAPFLLQKTPKRFHDRIKEEFIQSMVEIITPVCDNVSEISEDLAATCHFLESLAAENGYRVYAASLHPFAHRKDQLISPGERYGQIMDDLQVAGRRMITQGLHVHVGMPDAESAVHVCDAIRVYLPVLLALTTSSPFFQGETTGFYSYRSRLFHALPRSGIPQYLGSWKNFQELLATLIRADFIRNIRELWWDVRPHPDFGTVEIRICDLPSRFEEIISMTALVQALVATLAADKNSGHPNLEIISSNKWQASRYGLDGRYITPAEDRSITFVQAATDLLAMIRPKAKEFATLDLLHPIEKVIQRGTSAHRQIAMYNKCKDFKTIIKKIQGDFWN